MSTTKPFGSLVYHDIPEFLRALIEPVVADHNLELVDLEAARGHGPWRLRITVDTAAGDGRVPIDACAALSREIGSQLDAAPEVPAGYHLEVSSPGLDRMLSREKDFSAACGAEVRVETREPLDGRRRFRGRLLGFESGVLRLEVDGQPVEIPFAQVARANRIYEYTRADFGRGGTPAAQATRAAGAGRARASGTEQA